MTVKISNKEMMSEVHLRAPKALSLDKLAELNTSRLRAYYRKYRFLRDIGKCACCHGDIPYSSDVRPNELGNHYMDGIKAILDKKEHLV